MLHLYCATGNAGKLREFRVLASENPSLALELEKKGYAWIEEEVAR